MRKPALRIESIHTGTLLIGFSLPVQSDSSAEVSA